MRFLFKVFLLFVVLGCVAVGTGYWYLQQISAKLPEIMKIGDYKPLLVSEVYARGGEKIGEYYRENRIIVPYEKMPKRLIQAFLAAEDDTFFQHGGINYLAIFRAALANLKAGRTAQGASTITQQVAKSFFLTPEKTIDRKLREILLAFRIEEHLKKEEILYLYLNQIFFGEGAYGVGAASETYFRKRVDQLTLAEMALLAGLPQAPSRYSPADHPEKAKERQRYVLSRMATVGFVTREESAQAVNDPITVYMGKEYKAVAPFFIEALREQLVASLGEAQVLDGGLRIYTSLDYKAQDEAQNQVREGLRQVDKRQGWRGALKHLSEEKELTAFFKDTRKKLLHEKAPVRIILPEGSIKGEKPMELVHKRDGTGKIVSNIPDYINKNEIIDAVVVQVDDKSGLVYTRSAEMQALLDIADMGWARKPDPTVPFDRAGKVTMPSYIVKAGDVIKIRVVGDKFSSPRFKGSLPAGLPNFEEYAYATLEQEPLVEGALLSFDQKTQDVIAMVGGFDFKRNEYNRTIQAQRQTGSSFKAIVYASALDKGYTPATVLTDTPMVYGGKDSGDDEGQDGELDQNKRWKPHNYGNQFVGDVLFRTALIRSMNIPTVKIQEDLGVDWVVEYARRLGIFSPLNHDLSLALGSSGVTLYEMTKAFSQFGRGGKRIRPVVIHKVLDHSGKMILDQLSLDARFSKELTALDQSFETKRAALMTARNAANAGSAPEEENTGELKNKHKHPNLYFDDPEQLISPQTAYLITNILMGTSQEEGGTALRARALARPLAAKTGTTNGYFDTWFMGFTTQVATGVWVGFDEEKSLGVGEAGGRTALPIWLEYMKFVHKDLPVEAFPVPSGIVFANIDNQTGKLASSQSNQVVRQAFLAGTEPKTLSGSASTKSNTDFLMEDLTE